jgi:hypothetical protein
LDYLFVFFLLLLIAMPVMLQTPYLLELWLGDVPERSAAFVRLALLFSLSEAVSGPLVTLMLATGNIRKYQIIVGGLQLMNLPVSYMVLRYGAAPECILLVSIVISQCCLFARLILLKGMAGLDVLRFIRQVYAKVLMVTAVAFIPCWWLSSLMGYGMLPFIGSCAVAVLVTSVVTWLFGLSRDERSLLLNKLRRKGI